MKLPVDLGSSDAAIWLRDTVLAILTAAAVAIVFTFLMRRWSLRAQRKAESVQEDPIEGPVARRRATVISLVARTSRLVPWITVVLVVLGEIGVPLGPFFASAGIVGVALGFGAQTVVKDTLSGLFIALERQFDVGDFINLQTQGGPLTGTVERLTLRVTVLRQLDGTLSVVPNGNIQVTHNKTRGWGRAIIDVRIALNEDPERVRVVLEKLFESMVVEEPLSDWLLESPRVLGVTQLTDTTQVMRVVAQTQPNHTLEVERALRARAAATIARHGIRLPPVIGGPVRPHLDGGFGSGERRPANRSG